jgi:CheY-like chemotaxis protein
VRKKGLLFVFVFFTLFQLMLSGQNRAVLSELQTTLLIDSLENLLPGASLKEKAKLYDTLGSLAGGLSVNRSLHYYEALIKLPDSVTGFQLKVRTTKKIADIYYILNNDEKAEKYLMLYARRLKQFPQVTGKQFLHGITKKAMDTESHHFSFTTRHFLIILLILLLLSVVYLWRLHQKFVKVRQKKFRYQREVEIIKNKNQEVEAELEKIILSKTSVEEEKVESIRKKHLKLKKELNNLEEKLYRRHAFLSGLGPDLRTALNSIMGFALELKTEVKELDNEELTNNAAELFAKISQLDIILENIVDMASSNINVLSFSIQPVNVAELFASVKQFMHHLIDENRVILKTLIEQNIPDVKADKEKLKRVLNELVFNASGSIEEGNIEISAKHVSASDEIVIAISYQGEMHQDDDSGFLNNALSTGYYLTDKEEGARIIGLSTASDLVGGMHGKINIDNKEGVITIAIYLPAAGHGKGTVKHKPQKMVTETKKPGVDIFLVEDDRMNRLVIETMLKNTGNVTTAVDGEETLQIIDEYHKKGKVFDIMLFDINLPPPWDGIILMQKIREDYPQYRNVPFVAQTAYAMDSDRDRFLNEGFDDYLTKPINKGELITIIHHQLELFKNRNNNKQ